jgi:hypothetical protein
MHSGNDAASDTTKAMLAENMPLLLNTAWSLSALDIESSVRCVQPALLALSLLPHRLHGFIAPVLTA